MNSIPATISDVDTAEVHVLAPDTPLCASASADGLAVGSQVTLGIRPEHVQVGSGSLTGEVVHVEQMGEHTYLYLDTPLSAQLLIAKTIPGDVRIGRRLVFGVPVSS
ncbi:MAG: Glycerol-3-phosphate ABC transporter, ATP-binding protein UgpC (TC 3.A.1.1.3) [uncultured Caballeronia sp.]|nr:MAG: Glycerol-3-phosphate ABC transporter, ATP-binding protein UgpC (TC 3.A.1.1.3) [uncultured Caballeronia sp.]